MKIATWTITITDRSEANLKDKDIDEILTSVEWFTDTDLASFVESKIPVKFHDKIHIHVSD